MISHYIGVTALTDRVHPDELAAAATALQIQVTRDFYPQWGVNAIVSAGLLSALPAGTIPIIVQDHLQEPAANGFHRTRRDDTPYIIVPYGPNWPLAASHELLRMLADPSGSARIPGPSRLAGQGTVDYLLDVCGPCQGIATSYAIDGVAVADFCTRGFFATFGPAGSFAGGEQKPFEPRAEGIVTWLADDGLLYQARADQTGQVRVQGGFSAANRGGMLLRERVDLLTPDRLARLSNAPATPRHLDAEQNARRSHLANWTRFRDDISWRFGQTPEQVATVEPLRKARRMGGNGLVTIGPVMPPEIADPVMTVRSPS